MPQGRQYAIKTFAIDNTQFWPIRTPIDCAYWSVRPAANALIRSNADDSTTEDLIAGTIQEGLTSSLPHGTLRYLANDVICYLQSSGAPQTVIGKFVS